MNKTFYSNGKLLLTGEYAVLDGALALAVPTKRGQSLSVKEIKDTQLKWTSRDENGTIWFDTTFDLNLFSAETLTIGENQITKTLGQILLEAQKLNPNFLRDGKGCQVETKLTFPRDWGLGSSSTLINNIAQWAQVDAHHLLWNSFSGSGYDIACAQHDRPILYLLKKETRHPKLPWQVGEVKEVNFDPSFRDHLYFVYLNKKQNSREGIATYREMDYDKTHLAQEISKITQNAISCQNLGEFESLMTEHETLLSLVLQMPTVKTSLFPDFKGAIKSLGAWGGDFVLATGDETTPSYFKELGYGTVVKYEEMVLEPRG